MSVRNNTLFIFCGVFLILLVGCTRASHPVYVLDDLEILTRVEQETINGFVEGYLRESGKPVFVWITEDEKGNWDALRAVHPNFSTVKQGVLLTVNFSAAGSAIHPSSQFETQFPDSVTTRIVDEMLAARMMEGFVFEGIFEATKEITNIISKTPTL
jgi:uncharacterized membrane protein YgcG